jgi:hypothetical protein
MGSSELCRPSPFTNVIYVHLKAYSSALNFENPVTVLRVLFYVYCATKNSE